MNNRVLYFAYGSNMAIERLTERIHSVKTVCIASLDGHVLKFHKVGKDGSGKCDAARTGTPKDKIYGVLYSVYADELAELDRFEGRGYGYERMRVSVKTESGEILDVETYIASNVNQILRPYSWYKEHVLRGAKANKLPGKYVMMIEAVVADEDPDRERHALEMGCHR